MDETRSRKKTIIMIVVVVVLAYVGSYAMLIHTGSACPRPIDSPGDVADSYIWMSASPAWNEIGYYVYWPMNRPGLSIVDSIGLGDIRYVRDPESLRVWTE